jgi:hypothetical protein
MASDEAARSQAVTDGATLEGDGGMPTIDENQYTPPLRSDPASNAGPITPSDSEDLAYATRGLMAEGAGSISVLMLGGQTVTFTALASTVYPFRVTRVLATGTTATGILGLW